MPFDRIVEDPAIMAGAPTVKGTRVTVSAVLGQLAAGASVDELLASYPSLRREDVTDVLVYAAAALPQTVPFAAA
jgi:uncharacterized protein (DUF433 family)